MCVRARICSVNSARGIQGRTFLISWASEHGLSNMNRRARGQKSVRKEYITENKKKKRDGTTLSFVSIDPTT